MIASNFTLHHGDCLEVLRTLPDASVDAVVTDPPAGIAFMNADWDKDKGGKVNWIDWMFLVAARCLRVVKPGGHALVWSIPRTSHWTGHAWEEAGWECRDKIYHLFGSGFPKSHNLQGDWTGWGTALKPAAEEWWLLRKPFKGTVAENVLTHGTGAINVDGCRVGYASDSDKESALAGDAFKRKDISDKGWSRPWMSDAERIERMNREAKKRAQHGRWPANVIHDGSEEVLAGFPESGSGNGPRTAIRGGHKFGGDKGQNDSLVGNWYGDTGSAARFFYCAKASKRDRDEGCEGLEAKSKRGPMTDSNWSGNERFDGAPLPTARNTHPTVKPTELMRYLCRLITPPGGTVLDPFAGSGSTGKAAMLEGFRFIGIEREQEYIEIATARIQAVLDKEPLLK